jgi:hypothetical protein
VGVIIWKLLSMRSRRWPPTWKVSYASSLFHLHTHEHTFHSLHLSSYISVIPPLHTHTLPWYRPLPAHYRRVHVKNTNAIFARRWQNPFAPAQLARPKRRGQESKRVTACVGWEHGYMSPRRSCGAAATTCSLIFRCTSTWSCW